MAKGICITKIRSMTNKEAMKFGWTVNKFDDVPIIEFSNGMRIFPSQDEEGNWHGAIFGFDKDNNFFRLQGKSKLKKVM